ncbi:hypothetical protein BDY19DRAFT_250755 [Irpex rosettiformis]|uniref:Uncharacterized protein n=1 Tax=Irpex rosettiformis TaxID=378272 RepID=A0ACB8TZE9_9APHY|nr:hypothetical protein BDY19DRAFT_250755 [Irpex rosettiformis]
MFTRALCIFTVILGLALQGQAHAIITPALGVPANKTATRNDVQRPSNKAACGKIDIATALTSAIPVIANNDGTFVVNVTNFNGGKDGSRQVEATVDATALGKNFTAVTVTKNGDLAPSGVGSQTVTVQLPGDIKCLGGQSNDLCLVSFKTAAGFGNCVVVQQGSIQSSSNSTSAISTGNGTSSCGKSAQQVTSETTSYIRRKAVDVRAQGTRAARAYRRLNLE